MQVLCAYLKAYESKDLDTIASMLSDDVHLQDWNLQAHGKEAVLRETRKNLSDAQRLHIDVLQLYGADGCAAARLRILVNESIENPGASGSPGSSMVRCGPGLCSSTRPPPERPGRHRARVIIDPAGAAA